MIQRLVDSLAVLAAHRTGTPLDDAAADFEDALFLADSCQQETLRADERSALGEVERWLDRRATGGGEGELHELAAAALSALGYTRGGARVE